MSVRSATAGCPPRVRVGEWPRSGHTGPKDFEKIWYRALTTYMTSRTDYHGARTATLNAATDLYGASSAERAAVDKAWAGVNVLP